MPNIYTKEMSDNGELPSVGMMVNVDYGLNSKFRGKVKLTPDSKGRWIVEIDAEYCIYCLDELSPVDPPIELIDNDICKFEFPSLALVDMHGYVCTDPTGRVDLVNIKTAKHYPVLDCTNIQLLEVKS